MYGCFYTPFSLLFLSCLEYSWDIRVVFVGYSWDIRMYRVCIGYVSGMCREYMERNKKNMGSTCIYESFIVSLQKIMITFA